MSYKRVIVTEFGGPEVLKVVEETALPEPKLGEVRVKVLATSACFTDTMIRKGVYRDVKEKPPFSPGCDLTRQRGDDKLIGVAVWASFTAARRIGSWLHVPAEEKIGLEARPT